MSRIIDRANIILALFKKQKIEVYRNPKMLFMYLIFPLMALFYSLLDANNANIYLFINMDIIMPAITCTSSTIGEEREKGTLRSLVFGGVHPLEFFGGTGMFLILLNFISVCILGIVCGSEDDSTYVLLLSLLSIIISTLIGAIIGMLSKNQSSIAAVSAPVSLGIGMLSVAGSVNTNVHWFTKFMYSQAVFDSFTKHSISKFSSIVLTTNFLILFALFAIVYIKQNKVDE